MASCKSDRENFRDALDVAVLCYLLIPGSADCVMKWWWSMDFGIGCSTEVLRRKRSLSYLFPVSLLRVVVERQLTSRCYSKVSKVRFANNFWRRGRLDEMTPIPSRAPPKSVESMQPHATPASRQGGWPLWLGAMFPAMAEVCGSCVSDCR